MYRVGRVLRSFFCLERYSHHRDSLLLWPLKFAFLTIHTTYNNIWRYILVPDYYRVCRCQFRLSRSDTQSSQYPTRMENQWANCVDGPSNSPVSLTPGGQQPKSPSDFPRSHFYTDGSDSGEDSHMVGFMGPSSSEDNFNSQVMVGPSEGSETGTASRANISSSPGAGIESEVAEFEAAMDDQATVRMSRGSDTTNSSEGSSNNGPGPRQASSLGKAPMREEGSDHSVSTAGYQADMSTTLGGVPSSASSSRRITSSSRVDRRPSNYSSSRRDSTQSIRSRRTSTSQVSLAEQPLRSSAIPSNSSSDDDGTPIISRSSSGVAQLQTRNRESLDDFIVPRWQPDSEVTQCPICNAGFSWLNRKHHCRYVLTILIHCLTPPLFTVSIRLENVAVSSVTLVPRTELQFPTNTSCNLQTILPHITPWPIIASMIHRAKAVQTL